MCFDTLNVYFYSRTSKDRATPKTAKEVTDLVEADSIGGLLFRLCRDQFEPNLVQDERAGSLPMRRS